jgi:hypothetical protein
MGIVMPAAGEGVGAPPTKVEMRYSCAKTGPVRAKTERERQIGKFISVG